MHRVTVWSDKHQERLDADCEPLCWFAQRIAEAQRLQREGHDAGTGNGHRDPQYMLDSPATSVANLAAVLQAARRAMEDEKVLDRLQRRP